MNNEINAGEVWVQPLKYRITYTEKNVYAYPEDRKGLALLVSGPHDSEAAAKKAAYRLTKGMSAQQVREYLAAAKNIL